MKKRGYIKTNVKFRKIINKIVGNHNNKAEEQVEGSDLQNLQKILVQVNLCSKQKEIIIITDGVEFYRGKLANKLLQNNLRSKTMYECLSP